MSEIDAVLGIYLASFAIAFVSGVFPLVNAETYLVGVVLATGAEVPHAIVLGILVAGGQMVANSVLFHAARGVTTLGGRRREKLEARIMRARVAVAKWGNKRFALLCTSASVGLPPFLLTSVAAGALEIRFRTFLLIGLAGRTVRFAAVGIAAALV